jgi:drug/metabolite transporter (DMT)-like permease
LKNPVRPETRRALATAALYVAVIVCWSSSWYAAKLQGSEVDSFVSLIWRFLIATPLMFGWALLRREPLRFGWKTHLVFLSTGLLLFSLNFAFAYRAVHLLSSGVVSVIFSFSTVVNMLLAAVIFRQRPQPRSLLGAGCGVAGLVLLLLGDASSEARVPGFGPGVLAGFAMTVSFCLGNMGSAWTQRQGVPVIAAAAWSMAYGLLCSFAMALLRGAAFNLEMSGPYLGSLMFLAIFGTLFAFAAYLNLLGRVGPVRAAYATVWFPIGALMISSCFEGFQWTPLTGGAILMIAAGNIMVLVPPPGPREARNCP